MTRCVFCLVDGQRISVDLPSLPVRGDVVRFGDSPYEVSQRVWVLPESGPWEVGGRFEVEVVLAPWPSARLTSIR